MYECRDLGSSYLRTNQAQHYADADLAWRNPRPDFHINQQHYTDSDLTERMSMTHMYQSNSGAVGLQGPQRDMKAEIMKPESRNTEEPASKENISHQTISASKEKIIPSDNPIESSRLNTSLHAENKPTKYNVEDKDPGHSASSELNLGATNSSQDMLITILDKLVNYQRESSLPIPDLKNFDGSDLLEFPIFMKNFRLLVEDGTKNNTRRLELLLKYTKGEAYQLIKDCTLLKDPEEAYNTAVGLLKRDYGSPVILATAYRTQSSKLASNKKRR